MGVFQPRYIFDSELQQYGLPTLTSADQPDIQDLVATASTMIDEYCCRTDGDGNGSLAYTTYQERLMAAHGSNIYVIPRRPLVALTPEDVSALQTADVAMSGNIYTGCQPSINYLSDGRLSAIIAASGRYVPSKRDLLMGYSDYSNPISAVTLFGGPPQWQPIDMTNLDYNSQNGELWLSGGLMLAAYTEAIVTYTSGFDPRNMPTQVKRACAAATKNLMAKGSGTTGMTSFSSSSAGANASFDPDIIDRNIQRLLSSFVTVVAT